MTTLADVIPPTALQQLAANATLASILSALQSSRVETVWTDDTGGYFLRLDVNGAITWLTPAGAASSGPGTGAKPVGGAGIASDTTRWQATAAVAGSYSVGDYLSHIVTLDTTTQTTLGNVWINTTTGATLSAAPASANIAPIAPLPSGAATDGTLQLIKNALGTLVQAGGAVSVSNLPATQAVSATALPLPTGAATAVGQATGNTALGAIASPFAAATSTPMTATIAGTSAYMLGPFAPQLAREIWLTLNATVTATGTAQFLRSTDGGATKVGLTAGGIAIGSYAFSAISGAIANEIIGVETAATATYYLAVTLTAGTVTCRIEQ
jgi:hypothetical protein